MKAKSLGQLQALREQMRVLEAETAERRALEAARSQHDQAEAQLFVRSVGAVRALPPAQKAVIARTRPAPHARQRELDEQRAVQEALSDDVDVETLLLTDDGLSFRRPGIGPDVLTRLRRGTWALQGQLDLHGMTRDQAREQLVAFLRESHRRGVRCVRVVHGKGLGSPGRQPVLKAKVQRWLAQRAEVIAFAQASAPQGGAGALLVLLAPRIGR